jgi:hypothetical protein
MLAIVSIAPWLINNYVTYGDILKLAETKRILLHINQASATIPSVDLSYFWKVSGIGWKSFWGIFNAMRKPLNDKLYFLILVFQLLSLYGTYRGLKKYISSDLAKISICIIPLWTTLFGAFFSYNQYLFTPQGRYFYPILIPFALGTVYGWRHYTNNVSKAIKISYMLFMLLLNGFLVLSMPKIIFPIKPINTLF